MGKSKKAVERRVEPLVRRVFFTMVQHPKYGWMRVGKAYASAQSAREWVPFVRSYWRGLRTKVVSCSLRFVAGKLTAASAKKLDVKFNMAPPDKLEITSGERTAIELANAGVDRTASGGI